MWRFADQIWHVGPASVAVRATIESTDGAFRLMVTGLLIGVDRAVHHMLFVIESFSTLAEARSAARGWVPDGFWGHGEGPIDVYGYERS